MKKDNFMRRPIIFYLLISLITFTVYLPALEGSFINFDDPDYVTNNLEIQHGFTVQSVSWAFTSFDASNWHPLTWLSHILDYQLFGLKPWGHHLVNILLHICNTILLLTFLHWATGALKRSAIVTALFALHPMHVESVAWISERKDVLSTLFFLSTLLAYLGWIRKKTVFKYLLCLLFFVLSLLAKPMFVTLPFVLLLLDYWPLHRFNKNEYSSSLISIGAQCILEKIPFFVLIIASSCLTFFAQNGSGAVASLAFAPITTRLCNIPIAYVRYIIKLCWPTNLAISYPLRFSFSPSSVIGAIALLVLITIVTLIFYRKFPWLPFGWFWFLGILVPVIGIVQIGSQALADRYSYVSSIGIFIFIVWQAAFWFNRFSLPSFLAWIGLVLLLVFLCLATHKQITFWKSDIDLFTRADCVESHNLFARLCLIVAYTDKNNLKKAKEMLSETTNWSVTDPEALARIGAIFGKLDDPVNAILYYRKGLTLNPDMFIACNNLAWILATSSDPNLRNGVAAVRLAEHSCSLTNYKTPIYVGTLAASYAEADRFDDAIAAGLRAADLARQKNDPVLAATNEKLVELYRHHEVYHEALK